MANTLDDGRQALHTLEPISRPSSTSTQNSTMHHNASLPQLPGLSALASLASANGSPQLRYVWKVCMARGHTLSGVEVGGWCRQERGCTPMFTLLENSPGTIYGILE